jgi:cyclic pyranopterin monophosphate synthase
MRYYWRCSVIGSTRFIEFTSIVFRTAIIAGTMTAKKTGDLIPLCHPIGLESCDISIHVISKEQIDITCTVSVLHKTGVEMEALTGASVAALTVYDMCKAMSHKIEIKNTRLIKKTGGKKDYDETISF